jgi:hypothetical protein
MPRVHECEHECVHSKGIGSSVVKGRLVPDCEVQVVVDGVAERESGAEVVELLSRDAVDGRFTAVLPGGVERSPEVLGEIARQMRVELEQRIGL